jgi:WD40 repeat protein
MRVKKVDTLTGHKDSVYTLLSGLNENSFFSAGGDGMVVLWDRSKPGVGELIAQLPHSIYSLHRPAKTGWLLAGHNYDGIHALDWQKRIELKSLQLSASAIFDMQSNGTDLFVACGDGTVILIDLESWTVRHRSRMSEKSARTMAIHPGRRELAVGYSDYHIRILNMDDLSLKQEWLAHQNSVFTLAYSHDFGMLCSGSRDARIRVWDVEQNYGQIAEVVAHLYAINSLVFSPNGKHFVTCSLDKSIKIWKTDGLKLLKVVDKARHAGHGTSVNKLLWLSDDHFVSASDDRTIGIWNIQFDQD